MADRTPTFFQVGKISGKGMSQGDLYKTIYNFYLALEAIFFNLSQDDGEAPGVDFLDKIGVSFESAMERIKTPSGTNTY